MNLNSDHLLQNLDLFVEFFYDHFFEQTFEVSHIFRNTEIGKQKFEFKQSIRAILEYKNNISDLDPYFEDLGVRHMCYEVTNRHYQLAKNSFLYALEKTYAQQWNSEIEMNWNAIIDYISKQMKRGVINYERAS
ncbi:globin domain-containing protein [Halobacteriovorax sp. HLS]|uniref:globin domain-containing protein n=1 Tax=Halobacteriovorax sp. HLS TaxID=2234000 RepID=UPI000FDCB3A6|nr:globin domain-containing protein [Halobacteriovorax sp. HLS]